MSSVTVRSLGPYEFAVEVAESHAHGNAPSALPTSHVVRIDEQVLDDLGLLEPDLAEQEALVRESVEFLLEREPGTAIAREFDLSDLTTRFEDYLTELPSRLG